LSSAIKQKRIVPYFQAIAETPSGKIVKYEVLARLIDEQGKVIPPGQFIQLAK
jgi:EAL domain-containing protein (putative c-di-GMP-specific phosphodiesterase class I)